MSSTNKTDRHDITEILLKVALDTITLTSLTPKDTFFLYFFFVFRSMSNVVRVSGLSIPDCPFGFL
jgi:hypothetical protein